MRHYFPIFAVLGGVLVLFGFAMLVPLGFAWVGDDAALSAYDEAIVVTFATGLARFLACRGERRELRPRDGFLLVTLDWTVLPAFGALPLLFHLPDLSFTDAHFEAVSGLTTTGATVLTGLERLPTSINVWRCFMVLIGGMGILVLAVAILPLLGVGGNVVATDVQLSVLAFMPIYSAVLIGATMLLLLSGLDVTSAFSAAVACINNIGPGLGVVGPSGTYQGLSDFQTWVLSMTMLLGRVEPFSILVLLAPAFWRE
jgi:Trk-type K+ transport system membrane component